MKRVYLDHNAGSPMGPAVREALACALAHLTGNASSPHAEGQAARHALESARDAVAAFAGVRPSEVVFTSGGTEANNAALRGVLWTPGAPRRIVTTPVEHPSILETCRALRREGVEITFLPVDRRGVADPEALGAELDRVRPALVSVMHANNETGVIQPVGEMGRLCRERGVPFHSDMAQSAGKIAIRRETAASDLASLAAHKIGGPAGVGALLVGDGTPFEGLLRGGAQEGRRRAGTEAVPLAVAFAEACRRAEPGAAAPEIRIAELRDRLEAAILRLVPGAIIHGLGAPRIPNTTNVYLPGSPGRILVMQLDRLGYAVSTGSACSTGSSRPSHVLAAMGRPAGEASDSLRISLGPETTGEEVDGFLEALSVAVARNAESRAEAPAVTASGGIR